jgi:phage FluMu protein Com
MTEITFECPHCKQHLSIEEGGAGMSVNCPSCDRPLIVPSPSENSTSRHKVVGGAIENITGKVEGGLASVISAFISEQQDPAQVAEIFSKVSGILTKEERISYISIQNKPVVNVQPDAVVLTNRRFIVYRPNFLVVLTSKITFGEI